MVHCCVIVLQAIGKDEIISEMSNQTILLFNGTAWTYSCSCEARPTIQGIITLQRPILYCYTYYLLSIYFTYMHNVKSQLCCGEMIPFTYFNPIPVLVLLLLI